MQMSDAVEVVQVAGATNANKWLAKGWTLLAVVPNANNSGTPHVAYVLGRREKVDDTVPLPPGEHLSDYEPFADK